MTKIIIDIDIEYLQKLDKGLLFVINELELIVPNTHEIEKLKSTRYFINHIEKLIKGQTILNYIDMYKNKEEK